MTKATYVYLMNGNGDVMCVDCFEKSGLETGLTPDTYTWVHAEHDKEQAPICDKCNATLTDEDIAK